MQTDQKHTKQFRPVKYAQLHTGVAPHGMGAAMLSLALKTEGPTQNQTRAMEYMEERPNGVYAKHTSGREFTVPYSNISFLEYV